MHRSRGVSTEFSSVLSEQCSGTLNLLGLMKAFSVTRLVFSFTASTCRNSECLSIHNGVAYQTCQLLEE